MNVYLLNKSFIKVTLFTLLSVSIGIVVAVAKFESLVLILSLFAVITIGYLAIKSVHFFLVGYAICILLVPSIEIYGISIHVSVIFFILSIYLFLMRIHKYRLGLFQFVILTFLGSVLLSVINSYQYYEMSGVLVSFLSYTRLIEILFPLILLSTFEFKVSDVYFYVKKILFIGFLTCVLGIILFLFQIEMDSKTTIVGGEVIYRLGGVFKEANSFGHFAALMALLVSTIIMYGKKINYEMKIRNYHLLIYLFTFLVTVILTFSRSSILFFIIGLIILFFTNFKLKTTFKIIFISTLIYVIFSRVSYFQSFIGRLQLTFSNGIQDFNSISGGRLDIWLAGLRSLNDNLILGLGYRQGGVYDNNYVTFLVEGGVFGVTIFILFLLSIFIKALNSVRCNFLSLFLVASIVGLSIHMTFVDSFTFWQASIILFTFCGILFNVKTKNNNEEGTDESCNNT
ncbi:O-antigen ligase family protein [Alkalicoccobacillus plakortidis]|uniref:O-antigen ligase family protein n=1 Tax=Alkalicoccobacillus plakortidis TaxID=444060 RepID=A0ABT0XL31_9BACI|nr:O-antigen ligase family protein [Alkalicoccobacillus plakortidis]MCM2675912.1 O-antigen ligase family protein [Alkalicoccobacillus plakortidis]